MTKRIVVSDSSCLIDLRKVELLDSLVRLPYELLIPNTLFEEELLKFTTSQKSTLLKGGLQVVDIPGEGVVRAIEVTRQVPRLSIHDGFAFVLAEHHQGCILLSGDGALRRFAADRAIEVRGVLWVIDELHQHGVMAANGLLKALLTWSKDDTVRLPPRDLASTIKRYEALA
jgi:predicted nucleic acid-binding protein